MARPVEETLKHRVYVAQLKLREQVIGRSLALVRRRSFTYAGDTYRYHVHPYNTTWRNERTVEVAIAQRLLDRNAGRRVLELGNVMAYYHRLPHDVVDKYEQASGVVNVDVVEFEPPTTYDLILSLSTIEHIGWDEDVRDPEKPVAALERMASWLAPGGELFVTFPLGYNSDIDERVRSGALRFDDLRFMKRVSADNRWEEVDKAATDGARFGAPFEKGNVLALGVRRG